MKKTILLACAAFVAAAGAANAEKGEFNMAEKAMLRGLAAQMQTKLKKAVPLGNKAITLLPIRGDRDAYMEQQLIGALVDAGLTAVVPNDEKDARFAKILEKIRWDAVQTRLGSIDPGTVDELGRLMSSQVFLEARLNVASFQSGSGKRSSMSAELNLLAYAVQTKKYVWSATAIASESYEGKPSTAVLVGVAPGVLPLNVKVEVKPVDASASPVADRLDTLIRGSLAELGYLIDTARPADMTVSVDVSKSEFDKTGSYLVFDGSAKVSVSVVAGAKARLQGETAIDGRGMRGLGAAAANRNLAEALFEQLSPWLKRTFKADAVGFEAVAFTVYFPGSAESAADIAPIETFRRTITSMDGVRRFALAGQDHAANSATFRVVYEKGKFPIGFINTLFTTHPELERLLGD